MTFLLPVVWRPSTLAVLDACPARFAYREQGWHQRASQTLHHAEFGTLFHACAEEFDKLRFSCITVEDATLRVIEQALSLTWDYELECPLWGTVVEEWTCEAVRVSPKGRRTFLCDGARDWWVGMPRVCPKCGGAVRLRTNLVNVSATKNRRNLLHAVLAYCDAAEGLVPASLDGGKTPALEQELEFEVGDGVPSTTIQVHWDRYTALSDMRFVHERKTTGRYLGASYWKGYEINLQVAVYDLAAHKLGLRCDGVMLEAVQIQAGGVRLARQVISRGPEQRAETEREVLALIAQAHEHERTGNWPRRTASCAHAAGGMPCEFIEVCAAAPSARKSLLETTFVKELKA